MAHRHAIEFSAMPGVSVVAGVDIAPDRLAKFCDTYNIAGRFTDLDAAIEWGGFDAAVNLTPDAAHYATTMRLVETGKPIFCEKPLAPRYSQALEMTEAVEARGIVNMVNLRYRGLAVMQKARALVAEGAIGAVRHIDAAFLQSWLVGTHWGDWRTEERWLWRLSESHGSSGVLGDVGIHILDFATFVTDRAPLSVHCRLKTFDKAAGSRIGDYGLDANDSFVMSLEFEGGAIGTIHASRYATGYANAQKVAIFGTEGSLEITFESEVSSMRACLGPDVHTQTWRDVECPAVPSTYDTFAAAVRAGKSLDPTFRRAAELQRVIDLAFRSAKEERTLPVAEMPGGTLY